MTDLSRRNFLKGFMATAGIAAAGFPAFAAVVPEALPEKPKITSWPHERGDFFVKHNGIWRFLGRAQSVHVHYPLEEIDMSAFGEFNPAREIVRSKPPEIDAEILLDADGEELVLDIYNRWETVRMAFSTGPHAYSFDTWVKSYYKTDLDSLVVEYMQLDAQGMFTISDGLI